MPKNNDATTPTTAPATAPKKRASKPREKEEFDKKLEDMPFVNKGNLLWDPLVLARRLKNLLFYKRVTHAKLFRETGVNTSNISYYCTGKKTPKLSTALMMSNYLGVSLDYLVGNDERIKADLTEILGEATLMKSPGGRRIEELARGLLTLYTDNDWE